MASALVFQEELKGPNKSHAAGRSLTYLSHLDKVY